MKWLGFVLLAILAVAFLDGVSQRAARPGGAPAPVQLDSGAYRLLAVEREMRGYLADTPDELARIEQERRAHLAAMCREGIIERGYCRALDKP